MIFFLNLHKKTCLALVLGKDDSDLVKHTLGKYMYTNLTVHRNMLWRLTFVV